MIAKYQWWWYVVRNPMHQGTFLRKRNAVKFASEKFDSRGGTWLVWRESKKKRGVRKLVAGFRS